MSEENEQFPVSQDFTYLMIILGALGTLIHFGILSFATYEYRAIFKDDVPKLVSRLTSSGRFKSSSFGKKRRPSRRNAYVKKKRYSPTFLFMEFSMWTSNLLACACWFLLRTDLLFWGNENKHFDEGYCHWIYTINFVLFFYAKLWLHLLLVYRLHLTFNETFFEVNKTVLKALAALIVISALTQIGVFIGAVMHEVEVGKTHGHHLRVCTLFNANTQKHDDNHHSHSAFPIVFGVTDGLIDFATIGLFIRTLISVGRKSRDQTAFVIIRKLTVLGIIDVLFSTVLYTFAMPFYPNMVMLVPLDAIIDSLCIFLVSQFAHTFYNALCFPCDKVAVYTMEHLELSSTTSGGGHRGSEHSSDQSSGKSLRVSSGQTLSVGNSTKSQLSALSSVHGLDESSGFFSESVAMDTLTAANGHLSLVPNISDAPSNDDFDEKYAVQSEEDVDSDAGCDEIEERTRAVIQMMFATDAKGLGSGESNAVTGGTPPPAMDADKLKVTECLKSQSAIGLKEYHSHKAKATRFDECDDSSDGDLMSPLTGAKRTDAMLCAPTATWRMSKKTRSAGILETGRVRAAADSFQFGGETPECGQRTHRRALSEE